MQNLWKKKLKGKKKWGQRVFIHTAYLIMGFRLIFFSFFSIFKHCDLLAIIVVYFDSLKTHHLASTTFTYTPQFDHFVFELDLSIRSPARWPVGRKVAGDVIELHIYIEDFLFKAF